jgi:predicted nucleotidyltransferase
MKTSQQVYEDAKSLLEDTKIIDLFNNLGTIHIVGSYAANLMWDPDIDIVVITDTPKESAIKAINDLARKEKFQKLQFGDFKNYPMKDRPESFIINARKEWKGEKWEIETWFVTELDDKLEIVEKLKNLNNNDKEAIIEKKKQRSLSGNTKHDLSSWEIYQDFI